MKTVKTVFLFAGLFVLFLPVSSQTKSDSSLVRIETIDGNEFIGTVTSEDNLKIILKTDNYGEITIKGAYIKSIKKIDIHQIKDGKLWFDNPQSTRYFWSPNGFGLKKGEGYYQNIWVLWNQFAYGITDNFSIGAGIVPLFFFGGAATPIFATAKFSFPVVKNKFNVGAGAIVGTLFGESESGVGMLYGLSTFGSPDNNVTFGVGYGFAGGKLTSLPTINLNGMFRVSSRGYIITENYYINGGGENIAIISFGGRSIIKKLALDYGLVIPIYSGLDTMIALPWLGLTMPFGK